LDAQHKRVLVTGGVHRLGLHIAYAFAERGAILGLNYFLASEEDANKAKSECLSRGAKAVHLIKGDVTHSAQQIVSEFLQLAGGIDILVNNAGVMPKRRSLAELTREQLTTTLDLNLIAPFEMSKAAAASMQKGSAIVNIASLGGLQIWKERIDYNVSKSALITLTKALARDLAEQGITVNAVAPGAIQVDDETSERMGIAPGKIPMGQYGAPVDIAKAVLYFAYNAPYVTGQTIAIDGGRSVVG
jgi:NAD(P)-dependent dehydrogenase (short-subunit alcohol dehydrogenase family)